MAVFEYTAFDNKGRKKKGVIDADSSRSARQKLKEKNIFPVSLNESHSQKSPGNYNSNSTGNSTGAQSPTIGIGKFFHSLGTTQPTQNRIKVRLGDLSIATRQLSTLVGANIPLVESLRALSEQLESSQLRRVFTEVSELVNQGSTLAGALGNYPRVFPNLYINMISSGEKSGSLELVLERLADLLESQADLRRKVLSAAAYPIILLVLCILVVFFLLAFIVPQITDIFREQGQVLPLPTQMVIGLSNFAQTYWWLVLIGGFVCITGFSRYIHTKRGRRWFDRIKIRMPLFGNMNLKIATSRFARSLGTMLASGVELLTALRIVKNIVSNVLLEEVIENAVVGVREGKSLSSELRKGEIFPKLVVHLIGVGEKTGQLEPMLLRAAKSYETEVDALVSGLTKILEPMMILFLATVVGGILASIMLPMLEMSTLSMK